MTTKMTTKITTKIIQDLTPVNFTPKTSRAIKGIVIHSMAGTQKGSIAWFKNPSAQASAHYCISKNGDIVQCVLDKDIAWHTGVFDKPIPAWLENAPNNVTLGIELEDEKKNPWSYPEAQRKALKELVDHLCLVYNIPQSHILLHKELNPSRRSDPVPNFDINWVLANNDGNMNDDTQRALNILEGYKTKAKHGNLEGAAAEAVAAAEKFPLMEQDRKNSEKQIEELETEVRKLEQALEDHEGSYKALKKENGQLREDYNHLIEKLLQALNPLSNGGDEATIYAEIERLTKAEDLLEHTRTDLEEAHEEIAQLKSKLADQPVPPADTLPSLLTLIKLWLLKKVR